MSQYKDKVLDELLIMQMNDGSSKAMSLFVKRWHSKLIWYSYQLMHSKEEAKDIVQENWSSILQGVQNLSEVRSYKTWMYRVIRNKSIDRLRQLDRQGRVLGELESNEEISNENRSENNITIVKKLLIEQSVELREILDLFYLQQQSIYEISQILNIPQGTVKSRLYRAREQMKKSAEQVKHLFEF